MIVTEEYYWIQHKNGLLNDETYRSYLSTFVNNLRSSATMRETWDRVAQTTEFDPEFIAEIDAAVAAARNEDR